MCFNALAATQRVFAPYVSWYSRWSRFLIEQNYREKPNWISPNIPVLETKAFLLRQFKGGQGDPVLILPPQSGHHSCVVDYWLPGKSLVGMFKEFGNPVYAVEWKSADWSRRNETIDDLILQTDQIVKFLGNKPHMVGICQAGWQSFIYASLFPEKVATLSLLGSPIDFKAPDDKGKTAKIQQLVQTYPLWFYQCLVAMGGGVLNGKFMVLGFKNMNFSDHYIKGPLELYLNIDIPEQVGRSRIFKRWYEWTQNIAGAWYLQVVLELFMKNKLVQGRLKVLGKFVDPGKIKCPLFLFSGCKDDITPRLQVENAKYYVSTPSNQVVMECVPGGHIGIYTTKKAFRRYWRYYKGILELN